VKGGIFWGRGQRARALSLTKNSPKPPPPIPYVKKIGATRWVTPATFHLTSPGYWSS